MSCIYWSEICLKADIYGRGNIRANICVYCSQGNGAATNSGAGVLSAEWNIRSSSIGEGLPSAPMVTTSTPQRTGHGLDHRLNDDGAVDLRTRMETISNTDGERNVVEPRTSEGVREGSINTGQGDNIVHSAEQISIQEIAQEELRNVVVPRTSEAVREGTINTGQGDDIVHSAEQISIQEIAQEALRNVVVPRTSEGARESSINTGQGDDIVHSAEQISIREIAQEELRNVVVPRTSEVVRESSINTGQGDDIVHSAEQISIREIAQEELRNIVVPRTSEEVREDSINTGQIDSVMHGAEGISIQEIPHEEERNIVERSTETTESGKVLVGKRLNNLDNENVCVSVSENKVLSRKEDDVEIDTTDREHQLLCPGIQNDVEFALMECEIIEDQIVRKSSLENKIAVPAEIEETREHHLIGHNDQSMPIDKSDTPDDETSESIAKSNHSMPIEKSVTPDDERGKSITKCDDSITVKRSETPDDETNKSITKCDGSMPIERSETLDGETNESIKKSDDSMTIERSKTLNDETNESIKKSDDSMTIERSETLNDKTNESIKKSDDSMTIERSETLNDKTNESIKKSDDSMTIERSETLNDKTNESIKKSDDSMTIERSEIMDDETNKSIKKSDDSMTIERNEEMDDETNKSIKKSDNSMTIERNETPDHEINESIKKSEDSMTIERSETLNDKTNESIKKSDDSMTIERSETLDGERNESIKKSDDSMTIERNETPDHEINESIRKSEDSMTIERSETPDDETSKSITKCNDSIAIERSETLDDEPSKSITKCDGERNESIKKSDDSMTIERSETLDDETNKSIKKSDDLITLGRSETLDDETNESIKKSIDSMTIERSETLNDKTNESIKKSDDSMTIERSETQDDEKNASIEKSDNSMQIEKSETPDDETSKSITKSDNSMPIEKSETLDDSLTLERSETPNDETSKSITKSDESIIRRDIPDDETSKSITKTNDSIALEKSLIPDDETNKSIMKSGNSMPIVKSKNPDGKTSKYFTKNDDSMSIERSETPDDEAIKSVMKSDDSITCDRLETDSEGYLIGNSQETLGDEDMSSGDIDGHDSDVTDIGESQDGTTKIDEEKTSQAAKSSVTYERLETDSEGCIIGNSQETLGGDDLSSRDLKGQDSDITDIGASQDDIIHDIHDETLSADGSEATVESDATQIEDDVMRVQEESDCHLVLSDATLFDNSLEMTGHLTDVTRLSQTGENDVDMQASQDLFTTRYDSSVASLPSDQELDLTGSERPLMESTPRHPCMDFTTGDIDFKLTGDHPEVIQSALDEHDIDNDDDSVSQGNQTLEGLSEVDSLSNDEREDITVCDLAPVGNKTVNNTDVFSSVEVCDTQTSPHVVELSEEGHVEVTRVISAGTYENSIELFDRDSSSLPGVTDEFQEPAIPTQNESRSEVCDLTAVVNKTANNTDVFLSVQVYDTQTSANEVVELSEEGHVVETKVISAGTYKNSIGLFDKDSPSLPAVSDEFQEPALPTQNESRREHTLNKLNRDTEDGTYHSQQEKRSNVQDPSCISTFNSDHSIQLTSDSDSDVPASQAMCLMLDNSLDSQESVEYIEVTVIDLQNAEPVIAQSDDKDTEVIDLSHVEDDDDHCIGKTDMMTDASFSDKSGIVERPSAAAQEVIDCDANSSSDEENILSFAEELGVAPLNEAEPTRVHNRVEVKKTSQLSTCEEINYDYIEKETESSDGEEIGSFAEEMGVTPLKKLDDDDDMGVTKTPEMHCGATVSTPKSGSDKQMLFEKLHLISSESKESCSPVTDFEKVVTNIGSSEGPKQMRKTPTLHTSMSGGDSYSETTVPEYSVSGDSDCKKLKTTVSTTASMKCGQNVDDDEMMCSQMLREPLQTSEIKLACLPSSPDSKAVLLEIDDSSSDNETQDLGHKDLVSSVSIESENPVECSHEVVDCDNRDPGEPLSDLKNRVETDISPSLDIDDLVDERSPIKLINNVASSPKNDVPCNNVIENRESICSDSESMAQECDEHTNGVENQKENSSQSIKPHLHDESVDDMLCSQMLREPLPASYHPTSICTTPLPHSSDVHLAIDDLSDGEPQDDDIPAQLANSDVSENPLSHTAHALSSSKVLQHTTVHQNVDKVSTEKLGSENNDTDTQKTDDRDASYAVEISDKDEVCDSPMACQDTRGIGGESQEILNTEDANQVSSQISGTDNVDTNRKIKDTEHFERSMSNTEDVDGFTGGQNKVDGDINDNIKISDIEDIGEITEAEVVVISTETSEDGEDKVEEYTGCVEESQSLLDDEMKHSCETGLDSMADGEEISTNKTTHSLVNLDSDDMLCSQMLRQPLPSSPKKSSVSASLLSYSSGVHVELAGLSEDETVEDNSNLTISNTAVDIENQNDEDMYVGVKTPDTAEIDFKIIKTDTVDVNIEIQSTENDTSLKIRKLNDSGNEIKDGGDKIATASDVLQNLPDQQKVLSNETEDKVVQLEEENTSSLSCSLSDSDVKHPNETEKLPVSMFGGDLSADTTRNFDSDDMLCSQMLRQPLPSPKKYLNSAPFLSNSFGVHLELDCLSETKNDNSTPLNPGCSARSNVGDIEISLENENTDDKNASLEETDTLEGEIRCVEKENSSLSQSLLDDDVKHSNEADRLPEGMTDRKEEISTGSAPHSLVNFDSDDMLCSQMLRQPLPSPPKKSLVNAPLLSNSSGVHLKLDALSEDETEQDIPSQLDSLESSCSREHSVTHQKTCTKETNYTDALEDASESTVFSFPEEKVESLLKHLDKEDMFESSLEAIEEVNSKITLKSSEPSQIANKSNEGDHSSTDIVCDNVLKAKQIQATNEKSDRSTCNDTYGFDKEDEMSCSQMLKAPLVPSHDNESESDVQQLPNSSSVHLQMDGSSSEEETQDADHLENSCTVIDDKEDNTCCFIVNEPVPIQSSSGKKRKNSGENYQSCLSEVICKGNKFQKINSDDVFEDVKVGNVSESNQTDVSENEDERILDTESEKAKRSHTDTADIPITETVAIIPSHSSFPENADDPTENGPPIKVMKLVSDEKDMKGRMELETVAEGIEVNGNLRKEEEGRETVVADNSLHLREMSTSPDVSLNMDGTHEGKYSAALQRSVALAPIIEISSASTTCMDRYLEGAHHADIGGSVGVDEAVHGHKSMDIKLMNIIGNVESSDQQIESERIPSVNKSDTSVASRMTILGCDQAISDRNGDELSNAAENETKNSDENVALIPEVFADMKVSVLDSPEVRASQFAVNDSGPEQAALIQELQLPTMEQHCIVPDINQGVCMNDVNSEKDVNKDDSSADASTEKPHFIHSENKQYNADGDALLKKSDSENKQDTDMKVTNIDASQENLNSEDKPDDNMNVTETETLLVKSHSIVPENKPDDNMNETETEALLVKSHSIVPENKTNDDINGTETETLLVKSHSLIPENKLDEDMNETETETLLVKSHSIVPENKTDDNMNETETETLMVKSHSIVPENKTNDDINGTETETLLVKSHSIVPENKPDDNMNETETETLLVKSHSPVPENKTDDNMNETETETLLVKSHSIVPENKPDDNMNDRDNDALQAILHSSLLENEQDIKVNDGAETASHSKVPVKKQDVDMSQTDANTPQEKAHSTVAVSKEYVDMSRIDANAPQEKEHCTVPVNKQDVDIIRTDANAPQEKEHFTVPVNKQDVDMSQTYANAPQEKEHSTVLLNKQDVDMIQTDANAPQEKEHSTVPLSKQDVDRSQTDANVPHEKALSTVLEDGRINTTDSGGITNPPIENNEHGLNVAPQKKTSIPMMDFTMYNDTPSAMPKCNQPMIGDQCPESDSSDERHQFSDAESDEGDDSNWSPSHNLSTNVGVMNYPIQNLSFSQPSGVCGKRKSLGTSSVMPSPKRVCDIPGSAAYSRLNPVAGLHRNSLPALVRDRMSGNSSPSSDSDCFRVQSPRSLRSFRPISPQLRSPGSNKLTKCTVNRIEITHSHQNKTSVDLLPAAIQETEQDLKNPQPAELSVMPKEVIQLENKNAEIYSSTSPNLLSMGTPIPDREEKQADSVDDICDSECDTQPQHSDTISEETQLQTSNTSVDSELLDNSVPPLQGEVKKCESSVAGDERESSVEVKEPESSVAGDERKSLVAVEESESSVADKKRESSVAGEESETSVAVQECESLVAVEESESSVADKKRESIVAVEESESSVADKERESSVAVEESESSVPVKEHESSVAVKEHESEVAGNDHESSIAEDEESSEGDERESSVPVEENQSSVAGNELESYVAVNDCESSVADNDYESSVADNDLCGVKRHMTDSCVEVNASISSDIPPVVSISTHNSQPGSSQGQLTDSEKEVYDSPVCDLHNENSEIEFPSSQTSEEFSPSSQNLYDDVETAETEVIKSKSGLKRKASTSPVSEVQMKRSISCQSVENSSSMQDIFADSQEGYTFISPLSFKLIYRI